MLARPAERIPVTEILNVGSEQADSPTPIRYEGATAEIVRRFRQSAERGLGDVTLGELLSESRPEEGHSPESA